MFIIKKLFYFLVDTIQSILLLASFFLVLYIFFYRPFEVSGQSMYPNFHDKEYVLTDLISFKFSEPKKGEVIVFVSPKEKEKDYIKRIIATPGDFVSIRNGDVYVNNLKLNESIYLRKDVKTEGGAFLTEGQAVTLPQNKYFVLGDNRPNSSDSREWGFISREGVIGKSLFVYWPIDRARVIENPFKN